MKRKKWTRKRLKALDELLRKNETSIEKKTREELESLVDGYIAAKTKITQVRAPMRGLEQS